MPLATVRFPFELTPSGVLCMAAPILIGMVLVVVFIDSIFGGPRRGRRR